MFRKIAITFCFLAAVILAYGYRHAVTHGSLYVSLTDFSVKDRPRSIHEAELAFLDSMGRTLSRARATEPYGVVSITKPAEYSCYEIERQAMSSAETRSEWQQCFEKHSRWLMTWVQDVRTVDLKFGSCDMRGVPVNLRVSNDSWWLWWAPLPHVGGKPYTYLGMSIDVDAARCESVPRK
jgi:hypothetical protein